MATPIRIKRSAVPGKRPQTTDLQVGELALNTYDAELVTLRDRFSATGIATEVVRVGAGATVKNVIYVTKDGNDNNTGQKLGDAKATIAGAVGIAGTGDVIKVSAGTYTENNPIELPKQVSIVGDSLREVTVVPSNAGSDLFHVAPGNYLSEMSFTGTMNSGSAICAFNPNKIYYSSQSAYVSNCTNFVTNSIGLKIDGSKSIGPFKSMVTDAFTQYNSNGIGVSITNEGYAQIVSMFTINSDVGVACHTGGQCDITNSNSSFGNYGLIADGVGPRKYSGIITSASDADKDTFIIDLNTPTSSVSAATYHAPSGITTITTHTDHGLEVGMGVSLSKLGFTCTYGDYTHTFVEASPNGVTVSTGSTLTPTDATYNPNTGDLVLTVGSGHGLNGTVSKTASTATYTPSTGLLSVTTTNAHGLTSGDYVKFVTGSLRFQCAKDSNATNHDYPRISDPSNNKWLEVTVINATDFTVNVGASTAGDFTHTFVSATADGILRAIHSVGIATGGVTFTCTKDGNATNHAYPRTTDPAHNAVLGIEAAAETTITVNVGVSTHDIFPSGINGYLFDIESVPTSKSFSVYVGPDTHPHTYVSGGNVKQDIVRPYDGQVVYFDALYNTVGKLKVGAGGTGYTKAPAVTISAPSESWGVKATAVTEIKNGSVSAIEVVSNGRGYTSTPTITIGAPNSGINTATATLELIPTYYSIKESTPISSGISTVTLDDNVPYAVGVGSTVPFHKQSRILASSHSFEYIGTGVDPLNSLPNRGAVPIQDNEIDDRNGGLTIFTSTDQQGQFRIGDGVIINQQTGTISGNFYSKSLFSTMTPFILALGGD